MACAYKHCPKVTANSSRCESCGITYHDNCAIQDRCFLRYGDADNPANTIMCKKCQSDLVEMSLNASKLAGAASLLQHNHSMDTSCANNSATDLIAQMSALFDSKLDAKLSALRQGIQDDFKAELAIMKNDIGQNKSDIKSCMQEIQQIKDQVSSAQFNNSDNLLNDPHTLLSATNTLSYEIKNIESRNNNVMIYGVIDSDLTDENLLLRHDGSLLTQAFQKIDNLILNNAGIRRIGKYESNKNRPICLTLSSRREVFKILNNSSLLPSTIKVSTDKTRLQQRTLRDLRDIMTEHNHKYPQDPLRIKFIGNVPNLLDSKNELRNPKNSLTKYHLPNRG